MSLTKLPLRYLLSFTVLVIFVYHLIPVGTYTRPSVTLVRSTFDWTTVKPRNPISSQITLPVGKPHSLPRIQHHFGRQSRFDVKVQGKRRDAVRTAFRKCWKSYKEYAWLRDELEPLSASGKDTFGGWAATLLDSLDTLWIMDLKTEFYEAAQAAVAIDWSKTSETACNIFETTIRHLGGLLSAYDLSGERALLDKAVELGDMLYLGFDTPSRMPPFWLDFEKAKFGRLEAGTHEPSASSGTLSMEFTRLSQLTGDSKYYDAISRVTILLHQSQNSTFLPGMWPTFFNLQDGILTEDNSFTLGALSDSLYEYLPKMYALLGGLDPVYADMYRHAAETVKRNLLFRPMTPENADILFSGTTTVYQETKLEPEGQHLTCKSLLFLLSLFRDGWSVRVQKKRHEPRSSSCLSPTHLLFTMPVLPRVSVRGGSVSRITLSVMPGRKAEDLEDLRPMRQRSSALQPYSGPSTAPVTSSHLQL